MSKIEDAWKKIEAEKLHALKQEAEFGEKYRRVMDENFEWSNIQDPNNFDSNDSEWYKDPDINNIPPDAGYAKRLLSKLREFFK